MKIVDFKHWLQNWLEINHIEKNVPRSTIFPHRTGIVIGGRVKMGENCRINQGVTIGRKSLLEKGQLDYGEFRNE